MSDKSTLNFIKTKTWKREIAAALLAFLCFTVYGGDVQMVQAIIWPFTTFAALAFGLDWKGKYDANFSSQTDTQVRIG